MVTMVPRWAKKASKPVACVLCALGLLWSGYHLGVFGMVRALAGTSEEEGQQAGNDNSLIVRPFVMERVLISYTRDPKGEVIRRDILGRRSDGTFCSKVIPVLARPGETTVRHVMLPDGRSFEICDEKQIRATKVLTGNDLFVYRRLITPSKKARDRILGLATPSEEDESDDQQGKQSKGRVGRGCGHRMERKVGDEAVAGHLTQVWQKEYLGANQFLVRMSYYRARDLGCVPLKEVFEEQGPDGSYTRRWESVARYVNETQPSAEDLDLGEGYREVTLPEFIEMAGWRSEDLPNLVACGTLDCRESAMRMRPASGKPDFNGRWELDLAKSRSDDKKALPYISFSMIVAHNEPSLNIIHEVTKNRKSQRLMRFVLTTDGKPEASGERTASAWWEGDTLIHRYEAIQRNARGSIQVERRMRLSEDGLTMYAETQASDEKGRHPATGKEVWQKKFHPMSYSKMRPPKAAGQ